jgi:hypothetical protein
MDAQPPVVVHFIGRVFPDLDLTFLGPPTKMNIGMPKGDTMPVEISLTHSELKITCELRNYDQARFPEVLGGVTEISLAFVDYAAFTQGTALTLVIHTFADPTGETHKIMMPYSGLKQLLTVSFPVGLQAVIDQMPLRRILHDLNYAMLRYHLIPSSCGRAVEGIAQALLPTNDPKKRWQKLNNTLNISKAYLDLVTNISKGPHHGSVADPPFADSLEALRRSWVIANRYLEFLSRGGNAPTHHRLPDPLVDPSPTPRP